MVVYFSRLHRVARLRSDSNGACVESGILTLSTTSESRLQLQERCARRHAAAEAPAARRAIVRSRRLWSCKRPSESYAPSIVTTASPCCWSSRTPTSPSNSPITPRAVLLLLLVRKFPKCCQRRSVWGAYASRVWCSASRRTEFSGGTPEIARGDACAPRTYPEIVAEPGLGSMAISDRNGVHGQGRPAAIIACDHAVRRCAYLGY